MFGAEGLDLEHPAFILPVLPAAPQAWGLAETVHESVSGCSGVA